MKNKLIELSFEFNKTDDEILEYCKTNLLDTDLDLYTNNKDCFIFISVATKYLGEEDFEKNDTDVAEAKNIYNSISYAGMEYNGNTRDNKTLDSFYEAIKNNQFEIGIHNNYFINFCFLKV